MTHFFPRIDWISASGDVLDDAPAGYCVSDFFSDGGNWMQDEYETPVALFAAAQDNYLGADCDGIGMQVTIWADKRGYITAELA